MTISKTAVLAALLFVTSPMATAQSPNPKIGLSLQGLAFDSSRATDGIAGVLLGPETEAPANGLSLAESELSAESNVDDQLRAWITVAFENEDGETVVAVEEAYGETLAMPAGLSMKFGRFFSAIGYHNAQHSHAWDFADAPLAYTAFLANTYKDDGVQLRWLAPTDRFLEVGAELMRGDGFPGGGENADGASAWTAFASTGGDIGSGGSWQFGLSWLSTDANGRRSGEEDSGDGIVFSGDNQMLIVDAVYKWAPNGNPTERNAVLQAEYFDHRSRGTIDNVAGGVTTETSALRSTGRGYYLQAVYQFIPRWRVGARYDAIHLDNQVDVSQPTLSAALDDSHRPTRLTAMLDYSRSEFSRLRLQYSHDQRSEQSTNLWFLQYVMSIGAHPAHAF